MYIHLDLQGRLRRFDLSRPLDISMPLKPGLDNVNCFYAPPVEAWPVVAGSFIGSTAQGGPVNFFNIKINPHGNGTHTECVGHIALESYTINQCLRQFHFPAQLLSLFPQRLDNGDRVILRSQLEEALPDTDGIKALVLRTQPNDELKLRTNYSGVNPPYLHHEAAAWMADRGIEHLLIDLPSVDREDDGGQLLAHKAFWQYPRQPRTHCTISELIFVDNAIPDGLYLLNLQIASFEIDVSPSKPVLYSMLDA